MKILHLIYDHIHNPWVGGGAAVRVYEIYKRLRERHDITIACGKYPKAENYAEGNLNFYFLGTGRKNYILSTFSYALQARRFVKDKRKHFDIVIEDFAPYNPIFSVIWEKDAILQLHQREGWHHIRKYPLAGTLFWVIEVFYPKLFKNVIRASIANNEKFSVRKNIAILPNGYDSKLLTLETTEGDYVLYMGRLHIDQKGLDILFGALKENGINLIIAGSGKDQKRVQQMFEKYTQKGRVKIVGFVEGESKIDLLRKCQFLVIPSRYEGQSIVCLEAAACGKPVVVSDIPEMKYAVEAGFGISFKSGDSKDLGEKISFLLNNESLRKEMGQKAREFAENLSWDSVAESYEKFLIWVRS